MAETRYQTQPQTQTGTRAVDQGLRSYMLGIYNYMALGIAVTAAIVLASFTIPAVGNVVHVLYFPAVIAMLALGWFGPSMVFNGSVARAQLVFWAYVASWGIGIAPIVQRYLGIDPGMVMNAFLSAAVTFGAMSLWGYTSKRDLSGIGSMAIMALLGLFLAAVVNMVVALFTGVTGTAILISTIISGLFVIFVSVVTAWETQAIKEMYFEGDAHETAKRKSIFGAFALYGSFVSIFVNILQILGFMRQN